MRTAQRRRRAGLHAAATLLVAVVVSACVEETVYRDASDYETPPSAAANFIGYNRVDEKSTTCGACHTDPQSEWQGTRHADAWATLDSLPEAQRQDFCYECHTISANGNATVDPNVAYTSTKDMRYADVQCESCHGPGLEHIENPDATQPLPTLKAGTDITDGCGECHNGEHHPFVEEWSRSGHGTMQTSWSATGPQTRADCQGCHTGQGALTVFGVDARSNYKEKGQVATDPLKVTCGVCHDPHNVTNPAQLRLRIDVADEKQNLCMTCHHKRGEPDLGTGGTSTRGAHSPEGPMLLGEAGWWPPGMETGGLERITSSHGTDKNPRLCAGCHVEKFEVRDKLTDEFLFNATGHSFHAIPCVDANGAPTAAQDCDRNALTSRRFTACATSGCHASQDQARSALVAARTRIESRNAELKALLARVPRSEISSTDKRFTVAEGATFNTTLADKHGSEVHNPFLMEALLIGSINAVKTTYNL
jgi:predicted CXXCH cytochrome family protein